MLLLPGRQHLNTVFHFTVDRIMTSRISVTLTREYVPGHSKPYSHLKLCVLECVKEYVH